MKKTILSLSIAAFMAGSLITAQAQQTDEKSSEARANMQEAKINISEAKEDLKIAKQDSLAQLPKFKRDCEKQFKTNDRSIAELKSKHLDMNESDKSVYRSEVEVLEQKNSDLKMRLADYKNNNGREAFNAFKDNFNDDLDRVSNGIMKLTINYKR
jgi:uncharacterized protein HemX